MAKKFKVRLKRSTNGCTQNQKDTIRCLGLRKIGQEVVVADNLANRGQIFKMQHLLEVTVEGVK